MAEFNISEVSKLTNLKPHTLRYYECIGLIRKIKRNSAGKRIYSEDDLKWLDVINRLRATGMSINKMLEYARLRNIGNTTITERKNILQEHLSSMEKDIKILLEAREFVVRKIEIYNEMEVEFNGE